MDEIVYVLKNPVLEAAEKLLFSDIECGLHFIRADAPDSTFIEMISKMKRFLKYRDVKNHLTDLTKARKTDKDRI